MEADFGSEFDQRLAEHGPGAVFTCDADGELRLSPDRTRDVHALYSPQKLPPLGWCHCLYRDRATGFVLYALVTSPTLCVQHPRADVAHFDDQPAALAALRALGVPPVWHGDWPKPPQVEP